MKHPMMHPEHTPELFALAGISEEERKTLYSLDMGAGDGSSGCSVCIDIAAEAPAPCFPQEKDFRSKVKNLVMAKVMYADMLALPFPDDTFDYVLSQCSFYVSGNPERALREAMRVLRPGGKLLLSDVFFIDPVRTEPWSHCLEYRDITDQWREHYFRLLWEDRLPACFQEIQRKEKHAPRYFMLVYQKQNV